MLVFSELVLIAALLTLDVVSVLISDFTVLALFVLSKLLFCLLNLSLGIFSAETLFDMMFLFSLVETIWDLFVKE